jgi:CDGSH-type Zn-finger protein
VPGDKSQAKDTMAVPTIAQREPFAADVVAGRKYLWCACGRSKRQPFCDQSHKGSAFEPVEYVATETETVYFCGCKHSNTKPLCDGTHETL